MPFRLAVPVPTPFCYRSDTALFPFQHCSVPVPTPFCSRSDTALHTAQTMASSLHLSSEHQHLCAKGKSRRSSRTLHPHTPLTLNILQQTGVRKGLTKLPFTHICHLQFTKLHEAIVTDSGRQSIWSKFKACLWFKVMYQLIMERYWTGGLMEWRTAGLKRTELYDCRTG